MKKVISAFLRPVREQRSLFCFLLLMSCLVIPALCYATGAFPKPFVWAFPVFDCYLICLLAAQLKRVRLAWLVWMLSFLLLGGEVFSLLVYQSPYSVTVLQLILETNSRELTEFFGGHGVALNFLKAASITLIVLFVSLMSRAVAARRKDKSHFSHACKSRFSSLISYSSFLILLLSAGCQGYSYFRLWQAYTADVTERIAENKYMPLRNSPFIRFLYGHALNVVSTKELTRLVQTVERTEVTGSSQRSPLILLIIGESYNKYHSQLYNPAARPTTPRLCALQQSGNIICYDNAVSPYNVTSKTFRQMFSTYYPGCGSDWVSRTLFPAVFRKAGYRVWFFTNQFAGEQNNKDHHDHVGGTIFNQSELRRLQFSYMNTEARHFDGELLSMLPPADTLSAQPSLLIFHVIGQHEDYRERYPEAYNHFTADSIQNDFTDRKGRQIVAEYDNATLYNDAVVGELLEKVTELDAVGIYLSDHGEEIYDWRNSCYRTNSDLMTPEIARYQYEIPLLFYMSDTFRKNHSDLATEIEAARHKPFISSLLPFALFHLAGIGHADYESRRDILSPDYDESYPRIIRDDVDYDELMSR